MSRIAQRLFALAGWLMVAAVALAPLSALRLEAWGQFDTTLLAAHTTLLAAATLLALVASLMLDVPRRTTLLLALLIAPILLLGWTAALNPRAQYDSVGSTVRNADGMPAPRGAFMARTDSIRFLPKTVDGLTSRIHMIEASAALLLVPVAAAFAIDPRWRRRLLLAVIFAGVYTAAWGIAGRFLLPKPVDHVTQEAWSPFGPFPNHGNAGSFLLLTLPMALCAAVAALCDRRVPRPLKFAAVAAAAIIAAGLVVNLSRGALLLGILVLLVLLPWAAITLLRARAGATLRARTVIVLAGLLITLAAVALTAGTFTSLHRINEALAVWSGEKPNARLEIWKGAQRMAADAGLFGFGPGTYKILWPGSGYVDFPRIHGLWTVPIHRPGGPVSMYSNVHQDYLQTWIEFGAVGFALFALLVVVPVTRGTLAFVRAYLPLADRALLLGALAGLLGILLHALVDFPMQVPAFQAYAAVYLALAATASNWKTAPPPATPAP